MRTILILIIFLVSTNLYSQDTLNQYYYKTLKSQLESDPSIKKVIFEEFRYKSGKLQLQRMYIQLKDYRMRGYWLIGKQFTYFENGRLANYCNVDLRTKTLLDTSFGYYEDGNINYMVIYNNKSRHTKITTYFNFFRLRTFYSCYPDTFKETDFKDGKIELERNCMYNYKPINGDFDIVEKRYKSDGTLGDEFKIINKKIYKNGILVE